MLVVVGALLSRGFDARYLMAGGLLTMAIGNYWMAHLNLEISPWQVVWPRVVVIAGLSMLFAPLNVAAFIYLPKEIRGAAVGLLALLRNEGGSVGTSVAQIIQERREQFHTLRLNENLDPLNPPVNNLLTRGQAYFLQHNGDAVLSHQMALGVLDQSRAQQASSLAYFDVFSLSAAVGVVLVFFIPAHAPFGSGEGSPHWWRVAVDAMESLGRKSRACSAIFVVLALLLVSLAVCAPDARAQSWGEVVLHSFDGTDGATPDAGLIQGSDGNLYGTTAGIGMGFGSSNGTVFKITPAGALTTLYSFCGQPNCADGAHPQASLIQGSDGNFYGTTQYGGANVGGGANPLWTNPAGINPGGTVFKVTPSGKLTTLYSFCSQADSTDGQWPIAGVIQDADGNFYGTTGYGGAHGYKYGTVFKLTPSGTLTTLYSFCSQANCTDGASPNGVIQGGDGNFYGTTTDGGAHSNGGTVFKLTPSGTLTILYSFCSDADCTDGSSPNGVIEGGDGNFYGTTTDGGANRMGGTVFKLTPSGTMTTVYSFSGEADDTASPNGVILGRDGNLYGTTAVDPGIEPARCSSSRLPAG